jgi:hypothetical protein
MTGVVKITLVESLGLSETYPYLLLFGPVGYVNLARPQASTPTNAWYVV